MVLVSVSVFTSRLFYISLIQKFIATSLKNLHVVISTSNKNLFI